MRAIIAGFGYLGGKIAELLQGEHFDLTAISRSARAVQENGTPALRFIQCDLAVDVPKLELQNYDSAIFCLAPGRGGYNKDTYRQTYCDAQRNFLQAINARHYIFISSTAVYPDRPGTYAEDMALPHSERAQILLAAEQIALEQKDSCVLRLAGLYSAERPIYHKSGTQYNDDKLVHFIHRDDAARAVVHAIQNQLTGIFNVHDGNPQLRSTILNSLRAEKMQPQAAARRLLDCGKFFASGFRPIYADYFSGAEKVQN